MKRIFLICSFIVYSILVFSQTVVNESDCLQNSSEDNGFQIYFQNDTLICTGYYVEQPLEVFELTPTWTENTISFDIPIKSTTATDQTRNLCKKYFEVITPNCTLGNTYNITITDDYGVTLLDSVIQYTTDQEIAAPKLSFTSQSFNVTETLFNFTLLDTLIEGELFYTIAHKYIDSTVENNITAPSIFYLAPYRGNYTMYVYRRFNGKTSIASVLHFTNLCNYLYDPTYEVIELPWYSVPEFVITGISDDSKWINGTQKTAGKTYVLDFYKADTTYTIQERFVDSMTCFMYEHFNIIKTTDEMPFLDIYDSTITLLVDDSVEMLFEENVPVGYNWKLASESLPGTIDTTVSQFYQPYSDTGGTTEYNYVTLKALNLGKDTIVWNLTNASNDIIATKQFIFNVVDPNNPNTCPTASINFKTDIAICENDFYSFYEYYFEINIDYKSNYANATPIDTTYNGKQEFQTFVDFDTLMNIAIIYDNGCVIENSAIVAGNKIPSPPTPSILQTFEFTEGVEQKIYAEKTQNCILNWLDANLHHITFYDYDTLFLNLDTANTYLYPVQNIDTTTFCKSEFINAVVYLPNNLNPNINCPTGTISITNTFEKCELENFSIDLSNLAPEITYTSNFQYATAIDTSFIGILPDPINYPIEVPVSLTVTYWEGCIIKLIDTVKVSQNEPTPQPIQKHFTFDINENQILEYSTAEYQTVWIDYINPILHFSDILQIKKDTVGIYTYQQYNLNPTNSCASRITEHIVTIIDSNTLPSISGRVLESGVNCTAYIQLFKKVNNQFIPYETKATLNGEFKFTNLEKARYIIQAIPSNSEYAPTYYPYTLDWENAYQFNLQGIIKDLSLNLIKNDVIPNGNGNIHGWIDNLDTTKTDSAFRKVIQIKKNGNIVSSAIIYNEGDFNCDNLPDGPYEVCFNYPSFTTYCKDIFIYNAYTPGVYLALKNREVTVNIDEQPTIATQAYPQPAENLIYISNSENIETYSIYNQLGMPVQQGTFTNPIAVPDLTSGAYFLLLNNNSKTPLHIPIIKK